MINKNVFIYIILVIIIIITTSCNSEVKMPIDNNTTYAECPDIERLSYDNNTDTYTLWINCMPSPGESKPCGPNKEYEEWVNENCGIKFRFRAAY
jgi:hypothetical protein